MIQFILMTFSGFAAMEIFSYVIHRWIFHGFLWQIHQTHHVSRKGIFESNDVFSAVFAALSICLMIFAERPFQNSIAFPIGFGIAIYGILYFILHDLFTHRRFLPFNSRNKIIRTVRSAHQRHHQTAEKKGIEPFGLFLFDFKSFWRKQFKEIKKAEVETHATSAENI